MITRVVLVALLLASSIARADGGGLGKKDPGLLNLKGTIYALDENTERMPDDLGRRKPLGVVYTDKLDVPTRDFSEGFPGVTDRFEWFGALYTGTFEITRPGEHGWKLISDDGSRLWIDDKEVIDNDGQHATQELTGTINLSKGSHAMKVWYFQGPATEIALQLFVTPPGGEETIFALADYSAGVTGAINELNAEPGANGIQIKLDAGVLFDTGKHDLKPEARKTIAALAALIHAYPGATVEISGHTDSVGDDASNQKLSEDRARSVQAAVTNVGVPKDVKLTTVGFGETQPIANNETEKGRAQNRRVEILIHP